MVNLNDFDDETLAKLKALSEDIAAINSTQAAEVFETLQRALSGFAESLEIVVKPVIIAMNRIWGDYSQYFAEDVQSGFSVRISEKRLKDMTAIEQLEYRRRISKSAKIGRKK